MRRSISWMIGYDDYYKNKSFDKASGWDEEEWKLGFAHAMEGDYKLEKGIPIPKKRYESKYPLMRMEIGDSFVVESEIKTLSTSASMCRKRHGRRFTIRKTEDGSYRCWRIA